jgi:trehalose synthase
MSVLADNAAVARRVVRPSDVVLLHDHQTAGLIELLRGHVSATYWRCHVGSDDPNPFSAMGWHFLKPFVEAASGSVFSVPWHVPQFLSSRRVAVIPPFVSPYSAKNCDLPEKVVHACLVWCGLRAGTPTPISVTTPTGVILIRRPVRVLAERPPHDSEPLVVQVSRWDRLKDMHGVLAAFADGVHNGYLALVGPDPAGIPDDVEQADWFDRCEAAWRSLSALVRQRTSLICLPMDDLAENAVVVNAIQRGADVIAQKSLAEGFGLTVTEAMWKSRLVVASAVGGISSQIQHGNTGLLATDPADLREFGALLAHALGSTVDRASIGASAQEYVLNHFLPDRDVNATAALLTGSVRGT